MEVSGQPHALAIYTRGKLRWYPVNRRLGKPRRHFGRFGGTAEMLLENKGQSPSWEANRFSASQEIPHILWNPKVHYRIHKCQSRVPILIQLDPVHTPTSHFLKIHLNIILPSTSGSSKCPFPSGFPTKTLYKSVPYTCYIPRPSHSFRFDHPNNIWWAVQIIKFPTMYFSPLPCYLVHLYPKCSPQHPIVEHRRTTFLPQCERPSFTPIQRNMQNYGSVYLNV